MLKIKDVLARYGVTKPTIYRWIKDGTFPAPVKIGPDTVRWYEEDLEAFDKTNKEAQENARILKEKFDYKEEEAPLPDRIPFWQARGIKEQRFLEEGKLPELVAMIREDFNTTGAKSTDYKLLDFILENADPSRNIWHGIIDVILRINYEERKELLAQIRKD